MRITSKKWSYVILLLIAQTACAKPNDLCEKRGFEKVESGWVRMLDTDGVKYIDFITTKHELEKGESPLTPEMIMDFARDAAVHEFYQFYKMRTSQPWSNADLAYSHLESFMGHCIAENYYEFKVPISTFNWIKPNGDESDSSLAPIKKLLEKQGVE